MSDEIVAVVGCGNAKREEESEVRDIYTSNYFQLKREYAEHFADRWVVLSAEHDLIVPWKTVEPYDTTVEDVDEGAFIDTVAGSLRSPFIRLCDASEILVLAGGEYADRFRDALEREPDFHGELTDSVIDTAEVTYLFEEIGAGGIGEQMGWMRRAIDNDLRRPDDDSRQQQTALDRFEGRVSPVAADGGTDYGGGTDDA